MLNPNSQTLRLVQTKYGLEPIRF